MFSFYHIGIGWSSFLCSWAGFNLIAHRMFVCWLIGWLVIFSVIRGIPIVLSCC
jgi:hypothetical protein